MHTYAPRSVQTYHSLLILSRQIAHLRQHRKGKLGGTSRTLLLVVVHILLSQLLRGLILAVLLSLYTLFHQILGIFFHIARRRFGSAGRESDCERYGGGEQQFFHINKI